MSRSYVWTFALGAALVLAPSPLVAQNSIVGSWNFTLESPEGTFEIPLSIVREGEGLVARLPTGDVFFTGVETASGVEFHWDLVYQGMDLPTTLLGSFRDGQWSGTADFAGAASGTWVARPAPSSPAGAAPPANG